MHLAKDLSCPLLGLFGADDQYPSPDQVAELDKALTEAGKEHEFHTYEGAGHAFFSVNRPAYRAGGRHRRLAEDLGLLRPPPGGLNGGRRCAPT